MTEDRGLCFMLMKLNEFHVIRVKGSSIAVDYRPVTAWEWVAPALSETLLM
jgi:hypothetical protein